MRRLSPTTCLLLLLFAATFVVYFLSGPGPFVYDGRPFVYDGRMMYRVTESILWHHSVRIEDPLMHMNEPYATYGLAVSVLIMPLVVAGHLLFHDGQRLLSFYQPTVTAATVVLVALIAREIRCGWRTSLGLALLYGFGTLAWYYSNILFSEPLIGFCTALAFLALLRFRTGQSLRWLATAGCAVALALLARTDSLAVLMLPVSAYAVTMLIRSSRSWWLRARRFAAYGLPIVAAVAVVLVYDWTRYCNPLQTGYLASGMGFTFPLARGIVGLLVSPAAGLFVFVPVLILTVVGFPEFLREHRGVALLALALIGARLLFYAGWWGWDGGDSWGPRFLVPVLPVLVLPLAFLPKMARPRITLSILAGLSLGIEVLAQLVDYYSFPWLSGALPSGVSLPPCMTCGAESALAVEAAKSVVDFDWARAPMLEQLRLLMQYGPTPRKLSLVAICLVLVPFVGLVGRLGWRLLRLAEAEQGSDAASGPAALKAVA